MTSIIGHSQQREELSHLARQKKLPSAILLSGIRGIGKTLVAHELARQMLCGLASEAPRGGCGQCRACALFDAGTHPDIHTLRCGKEDGATVDDIRLLLEKMSLNAFMGGNKVAILVDADEISTVGANVILKSLEEPRPGNYFILVLANPSRLPSTILSRCQKFFFDSLSTSEITAIMGARGLPESSETLLLLADGSAASLDSLQVHGEMWQEAQDVIEKAWLGDAATIAKAAQDWGGDKGRLRERITLLRTAIRQKLLNHSDNAATSAVWASGLQNVLDLEYLIFDRHVNPTLAILKTLQSCDKALSDRLQVAPNSLPSLGEQLLDGR
jgi:hypothetical protein